MNERLKKRIENYGRLVLLHFCNTSLVMFLAPSGPLLNSASCRAVLCEFKAWIRWIKGKFLNSFEVFDIRKPFIRSLIEAVVIILVTSSFIKWMDNPKLVQEIRRPIMNESLSASMPKQNMTANGFELIGDGFTINDEALSALFTTTPANRKVALEPGKLYVITKPIILTKPISIDLMGSTIICKNATSVFMIQSDNVTIQNGVLDLNFTTHNGITGRGHKQILVENISVIDLLPSATNLEGGIFLSSCTDISVYRCTFKNIFNSDDHGDVDHSPAVKFVSCNNISIEKFSAENCGVGVNIYGSENVVVSDFNMFNIQNNGFYIQSDSKNIQIKNGKVNGAENGLAFSLSNYTAGIIPTTVSFVRVEFSNVTNKGISLREGSGLSIIRCSFIRGNCAVGQSSSGAGCSNIIIAENTINNPSVKNQFYLVNNTQMNIRDNTFIGLLSAKTFAINLGTGCTNNKIHDNFIAGDEVLMKNAIPVEVSAPF